MFDNSGTGGSQFKINTDTNNTQADSSVAMNNDGNFVVTWEGWCSTDSTGVSARIYSSDGSPVGCQFQVNTFTNSNQRNPSVALDGSANFIITWESNANNDTDSSGYGIFAQLFYSNGGKNGSEFQVNTVESNYQINPSVAMSPDGYFAIVWQSDQSSTGYDIKAQKYCSNGTADGGEFLVNSTQTNEQSCPSISMNSNRDFAIAWQSRSQSNNYYSESYNKENDGPGPSCTQYYDIFCKYYEAPLTETPTPTTTLTQTPTFTLTQTPSLTLTQTPTITLTQTPTNTLTQTPTQTATVTPTQTPTQTSTPNQQNPTGTPTPTPPPNAIGLEYFKAEAEPNYVILTWQTGTEIDTLGFYIVRSEQFRYIMVNKEIILSNGNSVSGYSYRFVDNNVTPACEYFYWLVDLDVYGNYTIHGPVKIITSIERLDLLKN
ncbi:hypothetical protein KKB18_09590 [bacterium]|nr:hypothetical protein [Bacteroidota bacterium]MBU1627606.1 hypothetical protein [bacterium]